MIIQPHIYLLFLLLSNVSSQLTIDPTTYTYSMTTTPATHLADQMPDVECYRCQTPPHRDISITPLTSSLSIVCNVQERDYSLIVTTTEQKSNTLAALFQSVTSNDNADGFTATVINVGDASATGDGKKVTMLHHTGTVPFDISDDLFFAGSTNQKAVTAAVNSTLSNRQAVCRVASSITDQGIARQTDALVMTQEIEQVQSIRTTRLSATTAMSCWVHNQTHIDCVQVLVGSDFALTQVASTSVNAVRGITTDDEAWSNNNGIAKAITTTLSVATSTSSSVVVCWKLSRSPTTWERDIYNNRLECSVIYKGAEWTLAITAQAITENAGVTVTQGSVTGTLKTKLQNEWTLAITPQIVSESSWVAVSQNEWTLAITAQVIAESAGVTVTQAGGATGTLKIALTGPGTTTSVVISTAAGVTFLTTADVVIGSGPSTCVPATTNAACSSIAAPANQAACDPQSVGTCAGGSGTECTSVANGPAVTCTGTNDDGGNACAWTSTNVCTYTATGSTILAATLSTATNTVSNAGVYKTSQNQWTMAIAAQTITESAGVTVTQGVVSGTLATALTGDGMVSVVVTAASGVVFVTTADLVIGSTPVVFGNVNTATNNGASNVIVETAAGTTFVTTSDIIIGSTTVASANVNTATNSGTSTSVVISTAVGVTFVATADVVIGSTTVVLDNVATATESNSNAWSVSQNQWTMTITSQVITESVGVIVTQGSVSGILKTALTGAGMTSVVITASSGVVFVTTADLVIGGTTVVLANVNTATNNGATTDVATTVVTTDQAGLDTVSLIRLQDRTFVLCYADHQTGTTMHLYCTSITQAANGPFLQVSTTTVDLGQLTSDTSGNVGLSRMSDTTAIVCWRDGSSDGSITKRGKCRMLELSNAMDSISLKGNMFEVTTPKTDCESGGNPGAFDLRVASTTPSSAIVCFTHSTAISSSPGRHAVCIGIGWSGGQLFHLKDVDENPIASSTFTDINGGSATNLGIMSPTVAAFTDSTTDASNTTKQALYCYESYPTSYTEINSVWGRRPLNLTCTSLVMDSTTRPPPTAPCINGARGDHVSTVAITAQGITENVGVAVSQKEWTLTITAQDITQSAGVTVTQGSNTGILKTALTGAGMTSVVVSTTVGVSFVTTADVVIDSGGSPTTVVHANVNAATNGISVAGTLKTALQNEWTLVVTAQPITELAGVTVTQGSGGSIVTGTLKTKLQNEWTLAITSQPVTQSAGVTVTQGSGASLVTGILKTALTGAGMTSVVITASSGATFVDTADVVIGSTTVLLATVTSATNTGATTSVVIQTASGVTFLNSANIIVGGTTVVDANINTATNTGTATNIVITAAKGVTFVNTADLLIGSTTVAFANVNTVTSGCDIPSNDVFVHKPTHSSSYLASTSTMNGMSNLTLSIPEPSDPCDFATALLNVDLGGEDIVDGTTNVVASKELCCSSCSSNSRCAAWSFDKSSTSSFGQCWLKSEQGASISNTAFDSGTRIFTHRGVLLVGVCASHEDNEWTIVITSQTITESAGVTVTQSSGGTAVTGTLKTALTGAGMTVVVIETISGVAFVTTADLEIGSSTVVSANVNTATNNGVITSVLFEGVEMKLQSTTDVGNYLKTGTGNSHGIRTLSVFSLVDPITGGDVTRTTTKLSVHTGLQPATNVVVMATSAEHVSGIRDVISNPTSQEDGASTLVSFLLL